MYETFANLNGYCRVCDTLESLQGKCSHQKEILLTPDEYQQLAARTDEDRWLQVAQKMRGFDAPNHRGLDARESAIFLHSIVGLTGEVGEIASAFERWVYYNLPLDVVNVKEEIGDCLWYLAQCCRAIGVNLSDVMEANIAKLRQRYPEKYTDEAAREENRNRAAERGALDSARREVVCEPAQFPFIQTGQGFAEPPDDSYAETFGRELPKAQIVMKNVAKHDCQTRTQEDKPIDGYRVARNIASWMSEQDRKKAEEYINKMEREAKERC